MSVATRMSFPAPAPRPVLCSAESTAPIPRPAQISVSGVELGATASKGSLEGSNRDAAAVGCMALDRLRAGSESLQLSLAITHARWWLEAFPELLALRGIPFLRPHVTKSPDDEVCLEWWGGNRKITTYFNSREVQFVKVWGADIQNEMEDGVLDSVRTAVSVWRWLLGEG